MILFQEGIPVRVIEIVQDTDWNARITTIASVLTLLIVVATAWIARSSLRDARTTRHGQLVLELNARWDDSSVMDSARHFREWGTENTTKLVENLWGEEADWPKPPTEAKSLVTRFLDRRGLTEDARDQRDMEDWFELCIYPNLIETIGLMLAEDALTIEVIDKLWGTNILDAWERWEAPIIRLCEVTKAPDVLSGFGDIAERIADHRANPPTETRRTKVGRWVRGY